MKTLLFGETLYKKINRHSAEKEIYYNEANSNLIIFDQDQGLDTESVINYTRPVMYDFLVQTLEEASGVVVEWYRTEDTTSDFIIYFDIEDVEDVKLLKNKSHHYILKKLSESRRDVHTGYKFNVVLDGVITPL